MLFDGDKLLALSPSSRAEATKASLAFEKDLENLESLAESLDLKSKPPRVPEGYHVATYKAFRESLWQVVMNDEPSSSLWTDVLKLSHALPDSCYIPELDWSNEVEGYSSIYPGKDVWSEFIRFSQMNDVIQHFHDHGKWPEIETDPGYNFYAQVWVMGAKPNTAVIPPYADWGKFRMRGQHYFVTYSDAHPFTAHDVGRVPPGLGSAPSAFTDFEAWESNRLAAALFRGMALGEFASPKEMRDFIYTAKPKAKEEYFNKMSRKLLGVMSRKPEANKPPGTRRGITSAEEVFRKPFSEFERNVGRLLPETSSATLGRGKVSLDRQFHIMSSWTRSLKATGVGNLDMSSWSKCFRRDRFLE